MTAGLRRRGDLSRMMSLGSTEDDRIDIGIRQCVFKPQRRFQAEVRCCGAGRAQRVDAENRFDDGVVRQGLEDGVPPPAEANDGGVDHGLVRAVLAASSARYQSPIWLAVIKATPSWPIT